MAEIFSRRATIAMGLAAAAIPLVGEIASATAGIETVLLTTADGRNSSVSRWRARRRIGTMLFSHGALSAPWKYTALIEPLVAAGWDVWAPLHVDSTDHPGTKNFPGLASWPARIEDMRALAKRIDAPGYVAAGHSYGALGALTLGGAQPTPPKGIEGPLADTRVSCVLAFSPPGLGMGLIDAAGYASLARPALIETGTLDLPPGSTDPNGWRGHLLAFDAPAPDGSRYAVVLDGADHYFGGLICRPELPGPRQTRALKRAIEASTIFLAGFGAGDRRATNRLEQITGRADGALVLRR